MIPDNGDRRERQRDEEREMERRKGKKQQRVGFLLGENTGERERG